MGAYSRIVKLRERVTSQGLRKTGSYLLFTVLGERVGLKINASFQFRDSDRPAASADQSFAIAHDMTVFDDRDHEALIAYGGDAFVQSFVRAFGRGELCAVGRSNGELATICWVIPHYRGAEDKTTGEAMIVRRCFTLPAYRGQGFYPNALRFLNAELTGAGGKPMLLIEASIFNEASIRGIAKSGCERIGTKIQIGQREFFIKSRGR